MKKNYFFNLFFIAMLFISASAFSQSNEGVSSKDNIEGLTIFPNPVSNGKVYINTAQNLAKEIEIFDVLGKKVVSQLLYGKELKIQDLNPGVYILKIKEGKNAATRKLVVR